MGLRLDYVNVLADSGATLSASSQQSGLLARYALDPLWSKPWRSAEYYNVVEDFNDKIDFNQGGVLVATLTPGNYATPALYAAHIESALTTAGLSAASVTYTSGVFEISSDAAFVLLWNTGANATQSAGPDMAYDVSADTGSATSHTAEGSSYHSREWLKLDLGDATDMDRVAIRYCNLGSGEIRFQAHTSDAWSSPDVDEALSGDTDVQLKVLTASVSKRWVRLLFDDVSNTDAYSTAGVIWAGEALEPTRNLSLDYEEQANELTQVVQADHGAVWVDLRPRGDKLIGMLEALPESDKDDLRTMADTVKVGVCFWLTTAPGTLFTAKTRYGYLEAPIEFRLHREAPNLWSSPLHFVEAVG